MASDGSLPVEWAGQAFPYLMHHNNDFHKTENYGSQRNAHGGHDHHRPAATETRYDRTGTWGGPAPRGYRETPMHAQDEPVVAPAQPAKDKDYIILSDGARLPLIGIGTYKVTSADTIKSALAAGYRHIDCAAAYENENIVGEGLKEFLTQDGAREQLWITSKVANNAHRPELVRQTVEKTIADLGCGHLDLLLMHWPVAFKPGCTDFYNPEFDTEVTLQQTWEAMETLVDAGLVRFLGVSNFGVKLVEEVLGFARIKPICNQVELHPFLPQRKLVGVCLRKGVHCVGFSPLGHSTLHLLTNPAVVEVANETGKTPAQVLLKWGVQRGVPVIPKGSSEGHIKENIEGLFEWRLTWDQKAKLDALENGTRFANPSWHQWEDPEEGGAVKPSKVL